MHLGLDNGNINPTLEMLGEAILFASIQFSIGSVEMSSKFSVKNFCSDQDTLQNAADAAIRGVVVKQWPEEINKALAYNPDQLKSLNALKSYMTAPLSRKELIQQQIDKIE